MNFKAKYCPYFYVLPDRHFKCTYSGWINHRAIISFTELC